MKKLYKHLSLTYNRCSVSIPIPIVVLYFSESIRRKNYAATVFTHSRHRCRNVYCSEVWTQTQSFMAEGSKGIPQGEPAMRGMLHQYHHPDSPRHAVPLLPPG